MLPALWAERMLKGLIMEKRVLADNNRKVGIRRDFERYRTNVCKIRQKKDELTAIKSKIAGLHSVKLTDMPKSTIPKSADKTLYLLQEKMDIEKHLNQLIKKRESDRKKLNKILKDLESDETASLIMRKPEVLTAEASVLKLRYMCAFSWDEINRAFYSEDKDFEINIDVYLKRIYRYHGQAFIDLDKMIKGNVNGY